MNSEDEPWARQAILVDDKDEWKTATHYEIEALEKMECWDVAPRQKGRQYCIQNLFTKKRSDNDDVKRYNARSVVCGNQEDEKEEVSFFPVLNFTTIKLEMCVVKPRRWKPRHTDFQNGSPSGMLSRRVYVEMFKYLNAESIRNRKGLRLKLKPISIK